MSAFEGVNEPVRCMEVLGCKLVAFHVDGIPLVECRGCEHPKVMVSQKQLLIDEFGLDSLAEHFFLFICEGSVAVSRA
jgi:hypothetical protein